MNDIKLRLKFRKITAAAIFCLAAVLSANAEPPALKPTEFNNAVHEWLTLRRELNHLRAEWLKEQKILETEIKLLLQQQQRLQRSLNEHQQSGDSLKTRINQARARITELGKIQQRLEKPLAKLEEQLRSRETYIPQLDNAPALKALKETLRTAGQESDLRSRLQQNIAACNQLAQVTDSINTGSLIMRAPDGREVEMSVLLFGLSSGLAISPDNILAAAGQPGAAVWQWSWRHEAAATFRAAFRCYRQEIPARFVNLPLPEPGAEVAP